MANGASELMAEFERSGDEVVLTPGGFTAFIEDFGGSGPRSVEKLRF